jgi:Asp-tRNA(Asn)/Glu-tRNA(Gln) amidotransferase C subunit
MFDANTIQSVLRSSGITISAAEAERLCGPLQAILADLQKLDDLEARLGDPDPHFVVEE